MNNTKRIILDTNALMSISELKLDLFDQIDKVCSFPYKIYVLEETLDELEKIIAQQRGRYKRAAKLALALLKAKKIPILPEIGFVDDLLVQHSKRGDIVITQDMKLKQRLDKPYLTIRQKKRIVMIE